MSNIFCIASNGGTTSFLLKRRKKTLTLSFFLTKYWPRSDKLTVQLKKFDFPKLSIMLLWVSYHHLIDIEVLFNLVEDFLLHISKKVSYGGNWVPLRSFELTNCSFGKTTFHVRSLVGFQAKSRRFVSARKFSMSSIEHHRTWKVKTD